MVDPPPEDPSGQPPAVSESTQPPIHSDLPHPMLSDLPEASAAADPSGHSQPPVTLPRPPLAELGLNGESSPAVRTDPLKAPSHPLGSAAPSRKVMKKKKKAPVKLQPYHLPLPEEVLQQKLNGGADALENRIPHGVGDLPPRTGLAAVVQPLQSAPAMDESVDEGEEEDESDDEDFDLEVFQYDESRRAELSSMMERYGVYDEEQLRLAVRRERKQEKSRHLNGDIPMPSSESAPASPTERASRFIPPCDAVLEPRFEEIAVNLIACDTHSMDGKSAPHANPIPNPMQSNPLMHSNPPMQPILFMQTPSRPALETQTPNPADHPTHECNPNLAEQAQTNSPLPSPARKDSGPPNPSLQANGDHINSIKPTPHPTNIDQAQKAQQAQQAHQAHPLNFFSNNPLAIGNVDDFPPLTKNNPLHGSGGDEDVIMVNSEEPNSRPNGAPHHVKPSPPIEQPNHKGLLTTPQPTTSLADRVKNTTPHSAPVAFNPSKYTPIGAKGEREGTPVISFSKTDTDCLAGRVGLAVVGKFSHSIPSSHNINKALNNIPIRGTLTWNFLNAKHVLIMLSDVVDYAKLLHGVNGMPVWYVESIPMRVFKWTPEFDPSFETPIVAVWCNLPALPIHLYDQRALYMICSSLGNPIQVDHATAARSRITYARVCVEIDITKPPIEEFVIDMAGVEVRQKVVWDKIPRYCSDCKHVGHLPESCYAFGRNARPDKKAAPQARAPGPRTKGVLRDPSHVPGAPISPPPVKEPHASSGAGQRDRAPGDRSVHPQPRSPARGQGFSGGSGPHHVAAGAAVTSKSPRAVSSSGLRPLRMGERHLRSSSQSPSRAPVAPGAPMALGARGAPSSPPRAPKVSGAPAASGVRGDPRPSSRGRNAPVALGDPLRRPSSPPSSPRRALHGVSLGEWIDVAQKKHKTSAYDVVANVPTKNAYVVLNDGTEMLEAEYDSEDDRDVEMTDDNKDMAVGSAHGSSSPNRGRVLPASLGGNLRSGVSAPASS